MIGNLCDAWPPASEEAPDPHQGTKTTDGYMDVRLRETLHDLHDGAWWSGVKILAPRNTDARFKIKFILNDGSRLWPDWDQTVEQGDWTPFPWLIPAIMAREMGLCLKIKQVDSDTNGCIFTRRVLSFLECPDMSDGKSLLFVDDDGDLRGYWDTTQGRYGAYAERTMRENPTPRWGSEHTVVPPTDRLITRRDWSDYRTFTPTNWSSCVRF
jgi:hypothetical protein